MTITDSTQARLMVHPEFSPLIDALIGQELSISALAQQAKLPLDTVHYRVKKLLKAGLLREVRQEKRAGRAIRIYSAVADSFFIPYSSFTHATLEEKFMHWEMRVAKLVVRSQLRLMRDTFSDLGSLGPLLARNAQGRLTEDLVRPRGEKIDLMDMDFPAIMDGLLSLRLPFEKAKALQAELDAIYRRYETPQRPAQGQRYALRLLLLPVNEADQD